MNNFEEKVLRVSMKVLNKLKLLFNRRMRYVRLMKHLKKPLKNLDENSFEYNERLEFNKAISRSQVIFPHGDDKEIIIRIARLNRDELSEHSLEKIVKDCNPDYKFGAIEKDLNYFTMHGDK